MISLQNNYPTRWVLQWIRLWRPNWRATIGPPQKFWIRQTIRYVPKESGLKSVKFCLFCSLSIQIVLSQTFSTLPHIFQTFLIYLPQVVRREVTISILMKPEIACTKNVRLPLFLFNRTIACMKKVLSSGLLQKDLV